jgi:hypothetical protein
VVRCGGDTDTAAAIAGGIIGSGAGKEGIPDEWLASLAEWPRTAAWMARLGQQLERVMQQVRPEQPISLPIAAVLLRNGVFLLLVLLHGLRRLLPPY